MAARLSLIAAILYLTAPAVQAQSDTWRPDPLIATRIQIALFSAPEIDPESIVVQSKDGVVTLVGVVPSADVKNRIERLARDSEGVRSLDSALTVDAGAAPPTPNAPPSDHALRGEVTTRLDGETALRDSEIEVRGATNGVVVLGGYANSLDDQLRALRAAKSVTGVTFVQNDMKTPPDTVHDLDLPSGQAAGGDARNRREQQAVDGRSVETPPVVPGAPTPPRSPQPPGAPDANVEGHTH